MKNQAAHKLEENPQSTSPHEYAVSRRILVVEDEPGIVQAYRDIISPAPKVTAIKSSRVKAPVAVDASAPSSGLEMNDAFELTVVTTGEEAVSAVKKAAAQGKPFAMGFFDVLLGEGIDGIETVKQIHKLDPAMYAVLVTAYQDRHIDSIQNIFGKEFSDRWDYLNKPFTEGEILQKARNMVSMWNIRQRDVAQREHLSNMKQRLNDNEKTLMVAAVARNVGHEFGNILLQIMGRADLARTASEADMRKAFDTILVATEHASKVLSRFKNLVRPAELGRHFEKIQIQAPIEETIALMEHELRRCRVDTTFKLNGLPLVHANHTALVQVFMNLVINACHAIKDKGKIEFEGKVIDDHLEVSLRDTGPGIPEGNAETIFDAFFTTKGDGGTGLGLSICKEIIEITHGGKISAENAPGGGAIFKILIPIEGEGEADE